MPQGFDVSRLYRRLPYGTTVPARCPGLKTIAFDCRVKGDWLERNIADTPFDLVDNRVLIAAADFSNHTAFPFHDVMVLAPVEYTSDRGEAIRGGHPIVEFETNNRSVLGGREKWGYPKLHSGIAFDNGEDGAVLVTVTMGTRKVMELSWRPDVEAPSGSEAAGVLQLWPHLLLRMLPDPSRPGMDLVEVLRRDTSEDLTVLEERTGSGRLAFGPWPEHEIDYCGLAELEIEEVISARMTVCDWVSSEKNGWARLVERLS
ncbi:acetoacetate decarboxylase family protein [Afifella sp. IM 167]|uniref:acetoacetate decarboxylase family protein n=1 Tax=Afifella sp. IM 167 TaxID=2033586 RepID=UPI001CCB0E06|nr:acetoacetate decarboxylase family protein [Afifella sp. IM 167]MBZ8132708.1 hypothetical protein [Afifella sp. IM 167]